MFHLHVWESVANNLIYSDLIRLFIYLRITETVVSETVVSEPALYFFVARKAENIDLDILRDKGVHFLRATGELKDYKITYLGLSMEERKVWSLTALPC